MPLMCCQGLLSWHRGGRSQFPINGVATFQSAQAWPPVGKRPHDTSQSSQLYRTPSRPRDARFPPFFPTLNADSRPGSRWWTVFSSR